MKIYFVVPAVLGDYFKPTAPLLGIGYLAAIAEQYGHRTKVNDMRVNSSLENLKTEIRKFRPQLIGITSTSLGYKGTYRLIDDLKKWFPAIPIVLGGAHASIFKEKLLAKCRADFIVHGEGEYTLLELINGLKKKRSLAKILGLAWRKGKKNILNPPRPWDADLNQLPFPALEKSPLGHYLDNKIPIVTSRGCPYFCVYCSVRQVMGQGFRPRDPENVVDEIEHWYKKGFRYFNITDDNFSFDMERAKKVCDLIIARGLKIRWELRNGIRVDRITPALAKSIKNAGCFHVSLGVESANQRVSDLMRKGIKISWVTKAIKVLKKENLYINLFFIIGTPGDTYRTFRQSLNFARKAEVNEVRFANAVPYPESEFYHWVEENGKFIYQPEEYLNQVSYAMDLPIFETEEFPKEERLKACEEGHSLVMELICRQTFGEKFGRLAFLIWQNKFLRKTFFKLGSYFWWFLRRIKFGLAELKLKI